MSTRQDTLNKQSQKIELFLEDEKQTQKYITLLNLHRKTNRFIRQIKNFEDKLAELTQEKEAVQNDLNTQDFQSQRDRYDALLRQDIKLDHEIEIIKDSKEKLKNLLLELEIFMNPQDDQGDPELEDILNSFESGRK